MPRDHDALPEAVRPFSRLLETIEAQHVVSPLPDDALMPAWAPDAWPVMGNLRRLVEWAENEARR